MWIAQNSAMSSSLKHLSKSVTVDGRSKKFKLMKPMGLKPTKTSCSKSLKSHLKGSKSSEKIAGGSKLRKQGSTGKGRRKLDKFVVDTDEDVDSPELDDDDEEADFSD